MFMKFPDRGGVAGRTLAVVLYLCWSTQAMAFTVNTDGDLVCGPGKQQVYWQEDNGMGPEYRDIVVLDYERFKGVLLYQEQKARSMVLDDVSAGTNIPWRLLGQPDFEIYGSFRGLPVDTSQLKDEAGKYQGKTVRVLIIGHSFYWPVCALTSAVDKWFKDAEK